MRRRDNSKREITVRLRSRRACLVALLSSLMAFTTVAPPNSSARTDARQAALSDAAGRSASSDAGALPSATPPGNAVPVASGNSAFPDLPTLLTANANGMVWETLNAAGQPTLYAQKLDNGATSGDPVQLTGGNFTYLSAGGMVPGLNLSIAGTVVAGAGESFKSFGVEQQRVSLYDLATDTATNPIITGYGDAGGLNDSVFFASAAPDGMLFVALVVPDSGPSTVHVYDEDMARDTPVDLGALPDASTDPTLLANVIGTTSPYGSVIAYPTTLTDGSGNPEDKLAFVPYNGDGPSVLATGIRGSFDSSLMSGGGMVAWADYQPGANGGCNYYTLPLDGSGAGSPADYNPANVCDTLGGVTASDLVLSPPAVLGGQTGDGIACPLTAQTCAGGKLATLDLETGAVTQSTTVDALSAASDGTSLYLSKGTTLGTTSGSAGVYKAMSASADAAETLLLPASAKPLSADQVALSPGHITWSDDSTADYPLSTRTLTADGLSPDLGPAQTIAPTSLPQSPFDGYGMSASGARIAYAVPSTSQSGEDDLVVRQPGGTIQTIATYDDGTPGLSDGPDALPIPGTVEVSGSNVLYLTADPTAGYDAHLYSTVSQTTRDFGPAAAFALDGGYLAWVGNDGSVWRQDIVADSAAVQLRAPTPLVAGQTVAIHAEVTAAGDYVGWLVRECVTSPGNPVCGGETEAAYRNAATMDPAQVVLTAPTTPDAGSTPTTARNIAMSDTYMLVDEVNGEAGTPGATELDAIRLADGSQSEIASYRQYASGAGKFAADGSTVALIDPDGTPEVLALDTNTDPPRVLTLDTPSTIDIGQPQTFELVASAPLSSCQITITGGVATVRTLDCPAADGDGIVSWDGTDGDGSPVAPGTYTWTVTGANGAGSLSDYSGADNPITGTVVVVAPTTTTASWPASVVYGQSFSVTATVAASGLTPTGTVTLTSDGVTLASQTLAGGTATLTVDGTKLTPGSHTLTVSYGGSDTLAPSSATASLTVQAPATGPSPTTSSVSTPTAISTTWPVRITYGSGFSVDVSVSATGTTPTGTVTLTSGGATLASQTLAGGTATLTIGGTKLAPGRHMLTISYSGSATTAASAVEKTLTVARAKAKLKESLSSRRITRGRHAKLTIRVLASGTTPTGKLTVYDGKRRLATVRLTASKKGKLTVPLPGSLKLGRHRIHAIYSGSRLVSRAVGNVLTLTVKAH